MDPIVRQVMEALGRSPSQSRGSGPWIPFDDGEDEFLVPSGRAEVESLVAAEGSLEGAVRKIVARFRALNDPRAAIFKGLYAILAAHGYGRSVDTLDEFWWFGRRVREFPFKPGKAITIAIGRTDPVSFLVDWFERNRAVEPPPSREEIERVLAGPAVELPRRALTDFDVRAYDVLPALSSYELAEIDRLADTMIDEMKREAMRCERKTGFPQTMLARRSSRLWYRPGSDRWADEAWWIEFARKLWKETDSLEAAAVLHVLTGDPEPLEWARPKVEAMPYYTDELLCDEMFWLLVDELPWPIHPDDYPDRPPLLGPSTPSEARKYVARLLDALNYHRRGDAEWGRPEARLVEELARVDPAEAREWIDPGDLEEILSVARNECIRWAASEEHFHVLDRFEHFVAASDYGWYEILGILERNRVFALAVLDMQFATFPKPGEVALHLTRFPPGELAARYAAIGLVSESFKDVAENARIRTGAPAFGHERLWLSEKALARWPDTGWRTDGRFRAAIAWTRCRDAGVGNAGGSVPR